MSRKKKAPKKIFYPDSRYGSIILSKLINFMMYDGKKNSAEKIIYTAFEQIKKKVSVEIEEVEIVKENIIFKTPGRLN